MTTEALRETLCWTNMMLGLSTSMTLDEGPLSRGVAPIQDSLLYEEVLSAATFASLECGASVLQTLWKVRKPTAGPPAGPLTSKARHRRHRSSGLANDHVLGKRCTG